MTNHFQCIIVDDEQDAIDLLAARLGIFYKHIEIARKCTSWEEALHLIQTQHFDIVFMDISLPGKNGINLLKLVPGFDGEIIFVTAHDEFALSAFELSASGYILKPIDDMALMHAVDKALERIRDKRLAQPHTGGANYKIGVPNSTGIDYISAQDILYFETVKGYTKVVTKTTEILSSFSIGKFKAVLKNDFYQVHRSYIVNLHCILRYNSSGEIVMQDKKHIPLSKNVKDAFLSLFNTVSIK